MRGRHRNKWTMLERVATSGRTKKRRVETSEWCEGVSGVRVCGSEWCVCVCVMCILWGVKHCGLHDIVKKRTASNSCGVCVRVSGIMYGSVCVC